MTSPRALANHELYLARILLTGWRRSEGEGQVVSGILEQAYMPAVREHLVRAYGWFLLAIVDVDEVPASPPGGCAQLPGVVAGKALPAEIRECRHLESDGWLCDLLDAGTAVPYSAAPRSIANLATAAADGLDQSERWFEDLSIMFERMGDSLQEC